MLRNLQLAFPRRLRKNICFYECPLSFSVNRTYSSNEDDSGKKNKIDIQPGTKQYKDPFANLRSTIKTTPSDEDVMGYGIKVPKETDILIIGGGAIGSAVAYWLKQRHPVGYKVTVIEKDECYTRASTVLSAGGIRQQFSLPENIKMSLFTAKFLRELKEHLSVYEQEPPDVQYNPQGYLFLASEAGKSVIHENHEIQKENGAKIKLMSSEELKAKFPWLNTDDIALGSHGIENEGWFDPWLLLQALRNKAISLDAEYVEGELVGFGYDENKVRTFGGSVEKRKKLNTAKIKHKDGKIYETTFAMVVNCAGPWAGSVGQLAGLGVDEGVLRFPLPIVPRKRYVYVIHCPNGPGLECPMVVDPSGVYFRREGLGGHYVCGASPSPDEEPETDTLDVDYDFFTEKIWPVLAHRVPAFECLKLKSAWAGFYDYNYFDQNLIIGNHPYHSNFFMATGCSGHGIQQAPAIGKAVMELIIDGEFKTVDLSRFSFDRFLDGEPLYEKNII